MYNAITTAVALSIVRSPLAMLAVGLYIGYGLGSGDWPSLVEMAQAMQVYIDRFVDFMRPAFAYIGRWF